MKEIFGFMKGYDLPESYAHLKNVETIKHIEQSVQVIMENPANLNFLVEQRTRTKREYMIFHDDVAIYVKVDSNTLHAQMEKSGMKFFAFMYYRHIDKYNLYRYNHLFTDPASPIYDLIHYLSSCIWEERLKKGSKATSTNIQGDFSNDRSIFDKELELRSKINRLFAKEAAFLTTEESHLLARYKNEFLLKTLDAFKELSDGARETHRCEVMNQFCRIGDRIQAIELKIDERKELVLLRQFHIMDQSN